MNVKTDISKFVELLLVGALFLCPILSNAQGNTWKLSTNNNVGPNDAIGSKNNADLRIKTNDKVRIVVTKDGDVGTGPMRVFAPNPPEGGSFFS